MACSEWTSLPDKADHCIFVTLPHSSVCIIPLFALYHKQSLSGRPETLTTIEAEASSFSKPFSFFSLFLEPSAPYSSTRLGITRAGNFLALRRKSPDFFLALLIRRKMTSIRWDLRGSRGQRRTREGKWFMPSFPWNFLRMSQEKYSSFHSNDTNIISATMLPCR